MVLGVGKHLLVTSGPAAAVLTVQDVYGVADLATARECVACLVERRDTILLPCRHLCVCRSCFDQFTNDTCPVCRAPFQSYLRFDGGGGSSRRDDDAAAAADPAPAANTATVVPVSEAV